ncbi:Isochorismatase-like protein, partial [Xylariales sp. PMI_506]
KHLSIPILLTTQNKSKLGDTVPSILNLLPKETPQFDKTLFSMITPPVADWLRQQQPSEVIIGGIEAHICVSQTALSLKEQGYKVTIIADAVSSSSTQERKLALERLQAKGIDVTSLESWVFDTVGDAKDPRFVVA